MENNKTDKKLPSRTQISFEQFCTEYEPLAAPYEIEGIRSLFFDRNDLYLLSKELQDRKVWSLIKEQSMYEPTMTVFNSYKIVSSEAAKAVAYITTEKPWELGSSISVDITNLLGE